MKMLLVSLLLALSSASSSRAQIKDTHEYQNKICNLKGLYDTVTNQCTCYKGFSGVRCEIKCPNECNKHGICTLSGECECAPGWKGSTCNEEVSCKNNCSNHGECHLGKCECHPSFSGETCEVSECHSDCEKCFCAPGSGINRELCHNLDQICPDDCNNNGICSKGVCQCRKGYRGLTCENEIKDHCIEKEEGDNNNNNEKMEKNSVLCSGHGLCLDKCECLPGYEGEYCQKTTSDDGCGTQCSDHGICMEGFCICDAGYEGIQCSEIEVSFSSNCPATPNTNFFNVSKSKQSNTNKICSGNGECRNGKCFCIDGYEGDDCSIYNQSCPQDCNHHGICHEGKCICDAFTTGTNCEHSKPCKNHCNNRGICVKGGQCLCEPGYGGNDCSDVVFGKDKCDSNCHKHGICHAGQCFCDPGYEGKDCGTPIACSNHCSNNGICKYGACFCDEGYSGVDCSKMAFCPNDCTNNGNCKFGRCWCDENFTGEDCSQVKNNNKSITTINDPSSPREMASYKCPSDCNDNGICFLGECLCVPGFYGRSCSMRDYDLYPKDSTCKNDCRGYNNNNNNNTSNFTAAHGKCIRDRCYCYPGYSGSDCSIEINMKCLNDCSGRGICKDGVCFCDAGYSGESCDIQDNYKLTCDPECENNGVCYMGRCNCMTGYSGSSCEIVKKCKNDCSSNGVCLKGECFCQHGYTGETCEIKLRLPPPGIAAIVRLEEAVSHASDKENTMSTQKKRGKNNKVIGVKDREHIPIAEDETMVGLPVSSEAEMNAIMNMMEDQQV